MLRTQACPSIAFMQSLSTIEGKCFTLVCLRVQGLGCCKICLHKVRSTSSGACDDLRHGFLCQRLSPFPALTYIFLVRDLILWFATPPMWQPHHGLGDSRKSACLNAFGCAKGGGMNLKQLRTNVDLHKFISPKPRTQSKLQR